MALKDQTREEYISECRVLNIEEYKRSVEKARRGKGQKDITNSLISRGIQIDAADIVPSEVSGSKKCEHNAKHVLYGVKLHLEKNIFDTKI